MEKKNIKIIKKYKDIIVAFILCSISMFLFAKLSVMQFGKDATLVMGDAQELYLPAIRALARNIWNGQGLTYSWDLSMGMNAVEYYTAVVGGSFVNIFFIIFPFISMETFLILALVIKVGLCGGGFVWFSKRVMHVEGFTAVLFSLFYALCGFQVCINSVNYIWIDMLYMLPIVLGLIVDYIENSNWILLVLAYAYVFICNFYIAYIVGFFSAVYFFSYLLIFHRQKFMLKIIQYAGYVFISAGLVTFALLPTAEFLLTKYHGNIREERQSIVGKNIFVHFSRLLWGQGWTDAEYYPYLYCGILILTFIPLFFICKKIDKKEKILFGILFGIMLLSCVSYPLYIFWHGFDEPDMWYYRFAFIISFLCVSMSCKAFSYIYDYSLKQIIVTSICTAILFVSMGIYANKRIEQPRISFVLGNCILFAIWIGLIIWKYRSGTSKIIKYIFALIAMIEVISNGCIGHNIYQRKVEFEIMEEEMDEVLNLLQSDNEFFRINNENRVLINADTCFGYKGITDFCSFENQELRQCLMNLGAYTSSRVVKGHGLNEFTQMILNVKYNVLLSGGYNREEMGAQVYQYPRHLSLGFLVDSDIKKCTMSKDIYDNNNLLASAMMGEDIKLFSTIPDNMITVQENGILLKEQGDYFLLSDPTSEETNIITYSVPYNGNSAYVTFGSYNRGILGNSPLIWEPDSGRDNAELTVRYTKQMDYDGEKLICNVMMKNGMTDSEGNYDQIEFCYLDEELLEKVYQKLSKSQLKIEKYKNGYITGNIKVEDESQVLFTSIPYDKGWKVKSKQGDVKLIPLVDDAFLGIVFPGQGQYDLELEYEVPGLRVGIIISMISLCIMIGLYIYKVDKNRDGRKKVQENN